MAGCIFNGVSPTTNAHIFRKAWMNEVFPGTERYEHRHVRRGDHGFDVPWSKDEADLKVNCVCARCNDGWMERLDLDAERIFLDHAVRGFDVRLDRVADKQLLARWCLLVAVLIDQVMEVPVLGEREHQALYREEIPEGAQIWLLRTDPPAWQVTAWGEPRGLQFNDPSAMPGHAYFVTFGVNHLVGQVYVTTVRTPPGVEFTRNPINAPIMRQLWPDLLTPFRWPPPRTVPWEQLPDLANALLKPRDEPL